MEELKSEYMKILEERKNILAKLNELENTSELKEYFQLSDQNKLLLLQQEDLIKKIKFQEYSKCNHIWVTTKYDYDPFEGRSYTYNGCIKCGLNKEVMYKVNQTFGFASLNLSDSIMYEFIKKHINLDGLHTNESCDLNLAVAIYSKIKANHPDIDDKTICKYFKAALNNIRKQVNSSKNINRAKRLNLEPTFKKWKSDDIKS